MQPEAVNINLEQLEDQNARLPNGEVMNLHSIKEGVFLYGVSIEGDDYIRGPLFYAPGDAILHALNPAYLRDTIGFASEEFPANTPSSDVFRFESMLRFREYRFDRRAFFYDARGKIRPACLDVGVSNFKVHVDLRLALGNSKGVQNMVKGVSPDQILSNIVTGKSEFVNLKIEGFHFCHPGKSLRIDKSYRLDMSMLWTFYVSLRSKGFNPRDIRRNAFLGDKSLKVIPSMLQDRQIPSTIGDLPATLSKSIDNGNSLADLARECATTVLGQKVCVSGIFFQRLWMRDVPSILKFYLQSDFSPDDKMYLFPDPLSQTQRSRRPVDPYIANWFYSEDFMPQMGRDSLAYNWNYNRYLDVNTVIRWVHHNLQRPFVPKPYQRHARAAFLTSTQNYDVSKHGDLIPHRFSPERIDQFSRVIIFDSAKQLQVTLSFDPKIEKESLTEVRGLYILTKILSNDPRTAVAQRAVQAFVRELSSKLGGFLKISQGYKDAMNEYDPQIQIVEFAPSSQTIQGIPTNWLVLPMISSLFRYLILVQEFDFITFE